MSQTSTIGISSFKTLKVLEKIQDRILVVLIDFSASHNFLFQRLMHKLKIQVHQQNFQVIIGNGDNVVRAGKCLEVHMHLEKS